ncbi:radical SAM protein [Streptococcus sciuri]|uniref:Radical SAM protein n=1 Tax=Streptococcus sciuri TaxID=2973939 RepID=A0ABT2F4V5_9STRE|nr:radical SAM protein [Streptococcus sciuri]MCS4487415.1 radical SAM protein [Streptococcus sciuri]
MELTNKCHLNCIHCYKQSSPLKRQFLNFNDLVTFLDKMKGSVYEIQLIRGELMVHPKFNEIAKYVTNNFEFVTMTTTGHFINSRNIELIKRFSFIQVSLYHYKSEINDKITKKKQSLRKTLKGIEYLIKSVRFGLFSHLGRGTFIQADWVLSKQRVENVSDLLSEVLTGDSGLSGGQKQRFLLVRVLLQDKEMLLLIESLSALVQATFDRLEAYLTSLKGKMLIHISHRYSEVSASLYNEVIKIEN